MHSVLQHPCQPWRKLAGPAQALQRARQMLEQEGAGLRAALLQRAAALAQAWAAEWPTRPLQRRLQQGQTAPRCWPAPGCSAALPNPPAFALRSVRPVS